MYSLLIMDDGGRPVCGNGGVADRVILCATFEALANPFTTTGLCILNAVVAKKGDERISIFGFFDKSGTFAVPAQTSSRTAVTPFTSAETKGLIILDWTTGAFLRNPVAAASTPIIGLDSTVSSESDAAREGQAESSAMTTKPRRPTICSACSCSACETLSSLRFFHRFDSKQAWCPSLSEFDIRLASGAVFLGTIE